MSYFSPLALRLGRDLRRRLLRRANARVLLGRTRATSTRAWQEKIIHYELRIDTKLDSRHKPRSFDGIRNLVRLHRETASLSRLATGQGSNSANLRQYHERVILTALRRLGQASKADLARQAGFTDNTAGVIVRELQERQLIRVEGRRTGARGQPATLLSLESSGAYGIGVKLGRRSLDGILVDFAGEVLEHRRIERPFPLPQEALPLTLDIVAELRRAIPVGRADRLVGVGLAMPYNLGSWRRELDIPDEAYAAWNEFDLAGRLGAGTGLSVLTENDGTAASVAELFRGSGRDLDSFLYIFVGTAIGGGVVLGGDYYRGAKGNAGDIGLMPVGPSRLKTAPVPERAHDVLLTRASISSLIRHLRGNGVPVGSRAELDHAIGSEPVLVEEWLEDCADAMLAPLLAAVRLLDLDMVVIDGDLPGEVVDGLIARLNAGLGAAAPEARDAPILRRGMVGRAAAAIGAAILPLHLNYSPKQDILVGAEGSEQAKAVA
jgi:predicted NBD/HSP70 family sugar kinase